LGAKLTADAEGRWLLPTDIPFEELKGRALEECLFWLLDGMGARDIEWRIGGSGAGAADGGRDIEARFLVPNANGQVESRRWWIECKGRSATLEKDAVMTACNNVAAYPSVDCLVVATNTTFSNPTRDWVKQWQERFPGTQILLWDRTSLERMLGQQPSTVSRLFEGGLSSAGYLESIRERFWNLLEYSSIERIKRIWSERDQIEIGLMERIALIANEFAHGSIDERPWGTACEPTVTLKACQLGVFNVLYLYTRMKKTGVDEGPIVRTLAYLILATLRVYSPAQVAELFRVALTGPKGEPLPEEGIDFLLMPLLDSSLGDLQLVCSSQCERFSRDESLEYWAKRDPLQSYWARFSKRGAGPTKSKESYHRLERTTVPCTVGFRLKKDEGCPLYQVQPTIETLDGFLEIVTQVVRARTPLSHSPVPQMPQEDD
jgi:hypothetical protein